MNINKIWCRRVGRREGLTHRCNQHQPILGLEGLDNENTGVAAQGNGNNGHAEQGDIGHGKVEAAIRIGVGRGSGHIWESVGRGRADFPTTHTPWGEIAWGRNEGRGERTGRDRNMARPAKITRRAAVGWAHHPESRNASKGDACAVNSCAWTGVRTRA